MKFATSGGKTETQTDGWAILLNIKRAETMPFAGTICCQI
jgi:hypothetical protein